MRYEVFINSYEMAKDDEMAERLRTYLEENIYKSYEWYGEEAQKTKRKNDGTGDDGFKIDRTEALKKFRDMSNLPEEIEKIWLQFRIDHDLIDGWIFNVYLSVKIYLKPDVYVDWVDNPNSRISIDNLFSKHLLDEINAELYDEAEEYISLLEYNMEKALQYEPYSPSLHEVELFDFQVPQYEKLEWEEFDDWLESSEYDGSGDINYYYSMETPPLIGKYELEILKDKFISFFNEETNSWEKYIPPTSIISKLRKR
tara:strand:- start:73 stop:840 length:768 start_codon:yes stop_codon:yes gene_type:complete